MLLLPGASGIALMRAGDSHEHAVPRAMNMKVWPGSPYPLGANFDGAGTNFSLFSNVADAVELCLFDQHGTETRVNIPEVTGFCWHGYLPGVRPGQRYAWRVHGPWDPAAGHRCNPAKLLLDPYAKAIEDGLEWNDALSGYRLDEGPDVICTKDSAPYLPKCVVHEPHFDWEGDQQPRHPQHRLVIYETHVKGFTRQHPGIPEEIRGTFAAIGHPLTIDHLQRLGVTAIELMPVHYFIDDRRLVDLGLRNYWGYNSIGYFAPHTAYAADRSPAGAVGEFKQMVKRLHQAGIEVILDVVYNHTAEGNECGPTLGFRGIDNAYYYRLYEHDRRHYLDFTGTGNTLHMRHPHVLQLIMDSLRYWVVEMHVDGFRFDLAAALARELHEVDRLSAFFDLVQQDPVVSQVHLIAEPWDVGEGGYQVGNFPPVWSEWNGRYRDCIRDYWRGHAPTSGELAARFAGSADLYASDSRLPFASVNFITAHDGFTLRDLVSYNNKHNKANAEENRDGTNDNRSWNCGAEGESDNPDVRELRARQQRNFLATLFLSQGIPMLLGGDELGRTQSGNNNAYCQDNEISWYDWNNTDNALLEFTCRMVNFRNEHPVFRRRGWFADANAAHADGVPDVAWFQPSGKPMRDKHWGEEYANVLGVYLNGATIPNPNEKADPVVDENFYIIFNGQPEPCDVTLPDVAWASTWKLLLDTTRGWLDSPSAHAAGSGLHVHGRSIVLLQDVG